MPSLLRSSRALIAAALLGLSVPAQADIYPARVTPAQIFQTAASQYATRAVLVAGTFTFTFPVGYLGRPVCVATGETGASILHVTPSISSCIVTAASSSDVEAVNIVVIRNPT